MLDDRKAAILRAVVEEYIDTAQPVGSQHVTAAAGINVSSATVRNEMAVLERDGYLVQPHTSAGRIPTDKGYRFFVDSLGLTGLEGGVLDSAQRQTVREFFDKAHGELEQMLADTSHLLSSLTEHTAVIVGPPHEVATVRSLQLVGLAPKVALAVAVLSNGAVEKHTVEVPSGPDGDPVGDERVNAASARLARHCVGRSLADVSAPTSSGDDAVDGLVAAALTELHGRAPEPDHVFVGGASRMADAFDAVSTVREVLGILEQQFVVVTLLRDVLERGLSVAIGVEEHGLGPLAHCSVVVASYGEDDDRAGTIGLLGPTRMHYPQALAAVAAVSQRLDQRLREG